MNVPTKGSVRSTQPMTTFSRGQILEVADNIATVKLTSNGKMIRARADMLPGKSAPPKVGEQWVLTQDFGDWRFAVPVNWSADPDWIPVIAFANSWVSVGSPNLPVGYRKDVEGWVTLCGRVSGGSSNTTAFTLPVGYRPQATWTQAGSSISIDVSGHVKPTISSGSPALDGIRFMAAS